jgi:hypothetical protein
MEKDKIYIYEGKELIYKELINDDGWYYLFEDELSNIISVSCKDFNNQ